MLTTVSFPSLRLGLHPILDYSVSLIRGHVARPVKTELESGNFLMVQILASQVPLLLFIETEEIMEQST